jgi:hypothetical protein
MWWRRRESNPRFTRFFCNLQILKAAKIAQTAKNAVWRYKSATGFLRPTFASACGNFRHLQHSRGLKSAAVTPPAPSRLRSSPIRQSRPLRSSAIVARLYRPRVSRPKPNSNPSKTKDAQADRPYLCRERFTSQRAVESREATAVLIRSRTRTREAHRRLPPRSRRNRSSMHFYHQTSRHCMGLRISWSIIESNGGRLWAADNTALCPSPSPAVREPTLRAIQSIFRHTVVW